MGSEISDSNLGLKRARTRLGKSQEQVRNQEGEAVEVTFQRRRGVLPPKRKERKT